MRAVADTKQCAEGETCHCFPSPPRPLSLAVTEGEAAPHFLLIGQRPSGALLERTLLLLLQITKSRNKVTFSS